MYQLTIPGSTYIIRIEGMEDLYTLRRARALYLLKKRSALPDDLTSLVDGTGHTEPASLDALAPDGPRWWL